MLGKLTEEKQCLQIHEWLSHSVSSSRPAWRGTAQEVGGRPGRSVPSVAGAPTPRNLERPCPGTSWTCSELELEDLVTELSWVHPDLSFSLLLSQQLWELRPGRSSEQPPRT